MRRKSLINFNVPIRQKCTIEEAIDQIDYLNVFQARKSKEWLLARIDTGEVEGIQIGNRWHVFLDSLEQYILKINHG